MHPFFLVFVYAGDMRLATKLAMAMISSRTERTFIQ